VVSARTYADFTPQATFDIKVSFIRYLHILVHIHYFNKSWGR